MNGTVSKNHLFLTDFSAMPDPQVNVCTRRPFARNEHLGGADEIQFSPGQILATQMTLSSAS